jgi:dTDP-4-dehydrorhamnose reductase
MKTLVTGFNGYLASNLCKVLQHDTVMYNSDVRNLIEFDNINTILHFACPSDVKEFEDVAKTTTTIIHGVSNMINIANKNNAKLVYASTMGVYHIDVCDAYSSCKLAAEFLIKSTCRKYLILRIPRVYSPCRRKGLMRQLREGTVNPDDMHRSVEYLPLTDFLIQTKNILNEHNIVYEYINTRVETIEQIKNWTLGDESVNI